MRKGQAKNFRSEYFSLLRDEHTAVILRRAELAIYILRIID